MANFAWLKLLRELSPAALTVRAQTVSPNDTGRLVWDIYFPRVNVDSTRFADIVTIDDRPVADRREWNAPGRRIPLVTPPFRNMEMVPIESEDVIDEAEMQHLSERALGNEAVIQQIIGTSLPARAARLATADYRRLEVDSFQAWSVGTVTVRNPQDASKTVTTSFGFDAGRYQTAGTAWDDAGLNAYDEFTAWLQDADDTVGGVEGAMMRRATLNAILADAPDLPNQVKMTRAQLADRISQDTGLPFRFEVNERTHDIFTDGGTAKTRTKLWPSQTIAAIPTGGSVGVSYFAPVVRAMDIATQIPGAGVDVNGVTIYYIESNDGKQLAIQGQLNAMPVPSEQLLFVIDVGV